MQSKAPKEQQDSLPKGIKASRIYTAIREAAMKAAEENGCPKKITSKVLDMMDNMAYQAIVYFYQMLGDDPNAPKIYEIQRIIGAILISNANTFEEIKKRPDWDELEKENAAMAESIRKFNEEAQKAALAAAQTIGAMLGRPTTAVAETKGGKGGVFGLGIPDPKGTLN